MSDDATARSEQHGLPTRRQAFTGTLPPRVELTPEECAELLDPESWAHILALYARTMRLAVALVDPQGRLSGTCHNPQPIWSLALASRPEWETGCLFCLEPGEGCSAAADALRTDSVVLGHDRAGFAHIASPLSLEGRPLGMLIAGQVFDRFPEPMPLERLARDFGLSAQRVWHLARQQAPISRNQLTVYGDLLHALSQAFLRERYSAILERKLAKTNLRFHLLVDGVKEYAIFTVDGGGLVTSWNEGAARMLGFTEAEILGRPFSCVFVPADIESGIPQRDLQTAAREGQALNERWYVRNDRGRRFVSSILTSVGEGKVREFGMIMHDITDRLKAEEVLLQKQKLESLGVMAGGIAHDFNNLLTSILGNASLLIEAVPDSDRGLAEDIVLASERAADLTRQMLAYSGKGRFEVLEFDLSARVRDMVRLVKPSLDKNVEIVLELSKSPCMLEGDPSQIQQVIMNLVINGGEAMDGRPGKVLVSTALITVDESYIAQTFTSQEITPGTYVCLEVHDEGKGMDEETQASIFDPFFTTKFTGRGLGLAAVSGIVRGHRGAMRVYSVPLQGTTFKVLFPAVEPEQLQPVDGKEGLRFDNSALVLLVDDEEVVRRIGEKALERHGYRVCLASDGERALELFRRMHRQIDVVVLDMTMTVTNGEETLRRMREISKDVRVIVCSGYNKVEVIRRFTTQKITAFLQKPYTAAKLAEKVKLVLETGGVKAVRPT